MTNRPDRLPRLTLTVPEVADRLGVPVNTVRSWIKTCVLPSIRVGGRRLVRVEDLEEIVNPNRTVEA